MNKVWMERGAFLDHEAEFLSNTLKGLAANYTVIMGAAKEEDEVNHLSAMQTRIEEIVKAEFESLKNAFCQEGGIVVEEDRPRTILTPDKVADKIEVNRYILTDTKAIVGTTTAIDMVSDEESQEILRLIAKFKKAKNGKISWINYWGGIKTLGDTPVFQNKDVVCEIARLAITKDRKEEYSVIVRGDDSKILDWAIVKTKGLAWLSREVK